VVWFVWLLSLSVVICGVSCGIDLGGGWSRTYAGSGQERVFCVATGRDGGYVLVGKSYSPEDGDACWLVKTDSEGLEEWNRSYGDYGGGFSVIGTDDGGFAISGWTRSPGAVDGDFWLLKADSEGLEEWNRSYVSAGEEASYSMIQTRDGGYALTGYAERNGSHECWLVKTDPEGLEEWNRSYSHGSGVLAYRVVQTRDGGYALAGQTNYGTTVSSDIWLVKTDAEGLEEWTRTYDGGGSEVAMCMIETSDGGYALAGEERTFEPYVDRFLLLKTDGEGNAEWNRTYGDYGMLGGLGEEGLKIACSLTETRDWGYLLAGYMQRAGKVSDGWVMETDSRGRSLWSETYGGVGEDILFSLVPVEGGYAIAGWSDSHRPVDHDYWLVFVPERGGRRQRWIWVTVIGIGVVAVAGLVFTGAYARNRRMKDESHREQEA